MQHFWIISGSWEPVTFNPYLTDGRHNHGMTTLNMIPAVFGGWNNGSLNTIEVFNDCQSPPVWEKGPMKLLFKREKFATLRVPKSFATHCIDFK